MSQDVIVCRLICPRTTVLSVPSQPPRGSEGTLRSEEHTSELQSRSDLVCRLLLEKKKHLHDRPVVPLTPSRMRMLSSLALCLNTAQQLAEPGPQYRRQAPCTVCRFQPSHPDHPPP